MVVPVNYLPIDITDKEFNRIIRFIMREIGSSSDLTIETKRFKQICQSNLVYEFIRLKHGPYYIDIRLSKFTYTRQHVTLSFGKVIDYNRTRFIEKPKTKK